MSKELKYLVIHATDSKPTHDVKKKDIEQWHLKGRGWSKVGYSDLIEIDGTLTNLIPFDQDNTVESWEISNGARGYNGVSRHVVYAGGKDEDNKVADTRTIGQLYTMEIYVRMMILRHPNIKVMGHNNISSKACPCFDVAGWMTALKMPQQNIYCGE